MAHVVKNEVQKIFLM